MGRRKRYVDPDIQALVEAAGGLYDARSLVVTQARRLNELYRQFESPSVAPMERLCHLASLKGLTLEPMSFEHRHTEKRDALVIFSSRDQGKQGHIAFNPDRSKGRIAFSVAHEIAHTFFPSTSGGVRFREMCESESREANELERLCDLGASELLMPIQEFQSSVAGEWSLGAVPRLADSFGSSWEATVFRLASAFPGSAAAGSLRFRRRKSEEAMLNNVGHSEQGGLFRPAEDKIPLVAPRKYRRQSFFTSSSFPASQIVPWNKSFDEDSVVYRLQAGEVGAARERLPNGINVKGVLEAMHAPYQRDEAPDDRPDVLFYWRSEIH
jgi:IrrE N-terminal-like domain